MSSQKLNVERSVESENQPVEGLSGSFRVESPENAETEIVVEATPPREGEIVGVEVFSRGVRGTVYLSNEDARQLAERLEREVCRNENQD